MQCQFNLIKQPQVAAFLSWQKSWILSKLIIYANFRYIEKCQNIKLSKIIADTKWIS
jgi:hypothetical protein